MECKFNKGHTDLNWKMKFVDRGSIIQIEHGDIEGGFNHRIQLGMWLEIESYYSSMEDNFTTLLWDLKSCMKHNVSR
jgi:hypothetical protein